MDSIQITARVPAELVARVDKFAGARLWSRARAIQVLIEQGLEAQEDE